MENPVLQDEAVKRVAATRRERSRIADWCVWLAYCVVVMWAVWFHEPWADEAQAWLMSRDLSLWRLVFSEMRYEGTPALWHAMLWAMTRVHLPYEALSWISAAIACAGAAYLIFKSPFPWPIRYGAAASYWIVYQYAVIARQYVLIPLLSFVAADLWSRAREKTYQFVAVLVVLALTSVHGMVIALAFAGAYLLGLLRDWRLLDGATRRRQVISAAVFAVTVLLIVLEIFPPADVFKPPSTHGVSRVLFALNGALMDWLPASLLVVIVLGAWAWRRGSFVLYVLAVGGMTALYGLIHGWPHHLGLTFVAALAFLWQSWPSRAEAETFDGIDRGLQWAVMAVVSAMLALHISYAVAALYHEYRMPYSGARDAARYVKAIAERKQRIYGYDYGMNAVLAYFDRNIIENLNALNNGASFFHHSADYPAADEGSFMRFRETRPEYLLMICWYPEQAGKLNGLAKENGYVLEQAFPGRAISKASFDVYQTYLLYRRGDLGGGQQSAKAGGQETNAPCIR